MSGTHRNGCFDRAPFVAFYPLSGGDTLQKNVFAGKPCEYRNSKLGKEDPACEGCERRRDPPTPA